MEVTKVNSEFPTSEDTSNGDDVASVDGDMSIAEWRGGDDDMANDVDDAGAIVKRRGGDDDDVESDEDDDVENMVSVSEAAAKIDADDLAAFLNDIADPDEYEQLSTVVSYFQKAFENVSAEQLPWHKLLMESPADKIANVPVRNISLDVYQTLVDWIEQRSDDTLREFVLWALDAILEEDYDFQVAICIVLAIVLVAKPDVMINVMPKLRENPKYQGQDKLPVILWMTVQDSLGDLCVGLYAWGHHTLPLLGGELDSNLSLESRELVLQLVEWILSAPKARTILVNGAVRKGGERLLPPALLSQLLDATFPLPLCRVKETMRIEAIYPTLKAVALAGSAGSTEMKQIMGIALRAASEGSPELSREATNIFIWCLSHSPDSYNLWDQLYIDNLEASVKILKKLSDEWSELSTKQSYVEALSETLKIFLQKDAARQAVLKDANKYIKVLLRRLSRGHEYLKSLTFVALVVAFGAGFLIGTNTLMQSTR